MSFNDKPGIPILGGYKLGTSDPIDVRTIAEDETDLQSLIDNGVAYEGLEVYVKSLAKKMQYNGTEFVEVSAGGGAGKVFENVTELPASPDSNVIYRVGSASGIVVPNTGIVDNVYFNTSLSIEEVIELVKNSGITFFDPINQVSSTEQGAYVVYAAVDSKGAVINTVTILYGKSLTEAMFGVSTRLAIYAEVTSKDENGDYTDEVLPIPIFASEDVPLMGVSAGWQGVESLEIGAPLVNNHNGLSVGSENDKLTSLFSLTSDFSANFSASRYVNVINGKEFELANTKEEYVIEFEYDKNKYSSENEFNDQVIKNYKLPDDLLSKFPDNISVRARITYIDVGMYPVQNRVEEYELQDYWLFPKFGNGLSGAQLMFRYVNAVNKTSNTIRLARFAAEGEEVISNNFFYNFSLGSGGSSSVTVDTAMSDSSTNPVQNKVIKKYIDNAISSSGGGSGVSKIFEDVEQLPEAPNSNLIYRVLANNLVISDGRKIDTLYFNTNLSVNDVKSIIDGANLSVIDGTLFGEPTFNFYPILLFDASYEYGTEITLNQQLGYDSNVVLVIAIGKHGTENEDEYHILFKGMTTGKEFPVFVGSNPYNWPLGGIFYINSLSSPTLQGIPIGVNNDKIANIVNIDNRFDISREYYNYDGTKYNVLHTASFSPVFIKKATFTNRGELYNWLYANYGKILKLNYHADQFGPRTFNMIRYNGGIYTCVDGISNASSTLTWTTVDEITCNELKISDTNMWMISRSGTGNISASYGDILDEKWVDNGGSVSVTVYYLD